MRFSHVCSMMSMAMEYDTGINLDKLVEAGAFISDKLGRESSSRVARAMAGATACATLQTKRQ